MPAEAWIALLALEATILVAYFRDEIRLVALRRRYALEREASGYRGTIEGRTVSLPNVRNVNEDVQIHVGVSVGLGRLTQYAERGDVFDQTFQLEAGPDVRYGIWGAEAESRALELARLGAFGTSGARTLSLVVPRARRFRDAPRSLPLLAALANHLIAREARLETVLRDDLALPQPRGLGALEGLAHRRCATPTQMETMLVPLIDGPDPDLRDRAARIADLYDVPATVTEALARYAPPDGLWSARSVAFDGAVARAVVRLGRLGEGDAIRWLDAPAPVLDVALDFLATSGGADAYPAVRRVLQRATTREVRDPVLVVLAKIRARLPHLGEGQLTFSEGDGGDLALAVDGGGLSLNVDSGSLSHTKERE